MEVPPESDDDEEGTDNDEDGDTVAVEGGEGPNDLDAVADGFVDDDFLKSDDEDDDDDERCRNGDNKVRGNTTNI